VDTSQRRVEVRAGLLKRRMASMCLHVMHGQPALDQARAAFVPEVVEVQIGSSDTPPSDSGLARAAFIVRPGLFFQIQAG